MQTTLGDTIAAISTASGQAAIAMVRLSGPDAISIVNAVFDGKDLSAVASHSLHFGLIREGDKLIDEVVAGVFRGPNSYTGEDIVEISCHGSDFIATRVLTIVLDGGARLAERGEFTLRAFVHGKMDLSQAESVADLIAAHSDASHQLAMKQLRGGVSNQIKALRKELVDFASLLELELDFAEEDVEFVNRDELKALIRRVREVVQKLIASFALGNAMKNGVVTVIAGRPNAGKSTLLNALLEDERAIVSEIPGTTRDTIEEILHIGGIAFRLVDTAGLRDAQDQIEALGVERAMQKIGESAIVLYVFDASELSGAEVNTDLAELRRTTTHPHILAIANKMDRNPNRKVKDWAGEFIAEENIIPVAALNAMNIEFLKERLTGLIMSGDIDPNAQIISSSRHHQALKKVDESLQGVERGFEQGVTSDFIAMDMRQALHWLGGITGEITTDDLLENIFSRFCIGK
jgi:tRNA modification GTPase